MVATSGTLGNKIFQIRASKTGARVVGREEAGIALREYALGLEALDRVARGEPLWRVHECVFGVLALQVRAGRPAAVARPGNVRQDRAMAALL